MFKLATGAALIATALSWATPQENTKFPPERMETIAEMMS